MSGAREVRGQCAEARDDETFSSAAGIMIPPKENTEQRSIPIGTDPATSGRTGQMRRS